MNVINLVTPKSAAKLGLWFNKPASGQRLYVPRPQCKTELRN